MHGFTACCWFRLSPLYLIAGWLITLTMQRCTGGFMVELGYALSSEEHTPNDLVRYARRAEETGFTFALISDHQIGPDQEGFFRFYERDVLPKLR
jgi:hypothetical protein